MVASYETIPLWQVLFLYRFRLFDKRNINIVLKQFYLCYDKRRYCQMLGIKLSLTIMRLYRPQIVKNPVSVPWIGASDLVIGSFGLNSCIQSIFCQRIQYSFATTSLSDILKTFINDQDFLPIILIFTQFQSYFMLHQIL